MELYLCPKKRWLLGTALWFLGLASPKNTGFKITGWDSGNPAWYSKLTRKNSLLVLYVERFLCFWCAQNTHTTLADSSRATACKCLQPKSQRRNCCFHYAHDQNIPCHKSLKWPVYRGFKAAASIRMQNTIDNFRFCTQCMEELRRFHHQRNHHLESYLK